MKPTKTTSIDLPGDFCAGSIGDLVVPGARVDVWEIPSRKTGWLYGVGANANNGVVAFAGMLWLRERLRDDQIAPVALPTGAGKLAEVAHSHLKGAISPLIPLVELALFKLGLMQVQSTAAAPDVNYYVTSFELGSKVRIHPGAIVKKSLLTFQPGEELHRPTAVDAQLSLGSWDETIAFSQRYSNLIWLEDPLPSDQWRDDPACPIPLATGEHATSVSDVELVLRNANSISMIIHLELSRLGPIGLAACLHLARHRKVPVAFHGHLPFDTALVLQYLRIGGLIELNFAHLPERAPWPHAARLVDGPIKPTHVSVTGEVLAGTLAAGPPPRALRRS